MDEIIQLNLFIYNRHEPGWQVLSAGKWMNNYSYLSTDSKWSIAHLRWWISNSNLSSLFLHHQTHPSGDNSFSWQAETVISHCDQNSHQALLLCIPINDRWGVCKSLPRSHNFVPLPLVGLLNLIYMSLTSGSSLTWGKGTSTAGCTCWSTMFMFHKSDVLFKCQR